MTEHSYSKEETIALINKISELLGFDLMNLNLYRIKFMCMQSGQFFDLSIKNMITEIDHEMVYIVFLTDGYDIQTHKYIKSEGIVIKMSIPRKWKKKQFDFYECIVYGVEALVGVSEYIPELQIINIC